MDPAQNPNDINIPPKPPRGKLKVAALSVFIILIFIPISIYGVAFFFQFLFISGLSGEGKYLIGSLGVLLIFLALTYLAIRIFRSKVRTYLGPKSKLLLIIPLTIIVLPILWIIFVQFREQIAINRIDTEAKNCQNLFANSFKINKITNETHNPGDKFITLEVNATISVPGDITPSYVLRDPKNSNRILLSLEWLEDAGKNAIGYPKFFEQGTQNIKMALKLNEDPYHYTDWIEKRSFTIENFVFYTRNENLCKYPGHEMIAYGAYTTKEYLRNDFLNEREKQTGSNGYSLFRTDGREGRVKVLPNAGPTIGGTTVTLEGLFGGPLGPYPIKNVFFGDNAVKSFKVTSNKSGLEVITPPGEAGTVDIWIVPEKYSAIRWIKGFTYK